MRRESRATHLAGFARNEACDRLSVSSFVLDGVLRQGLAFTGNPDLVALELHGDWRGSGLFAAAALAVAVSVDG